MRWDWWASRRLKIYLALIVYRTVLFEVPETNLMLSMFLRQITICSARWVHLMRAIPTARVNPKEYRCARQYLMHVTDCYRVEGRIDDMCWVNTTTIRGSSRRAKDNTYESDALARVDTAPSTIRLDLERSSSCKSTDDMYRARLCGNLICREESLRAWTHSFNYGVTSRALTRTFSSRSNPLVWPTMIRFMQSGMCEWDTSACGWANVIDTDELHLVFGIFWIWFIWSYYHPLRLATSMVIRENIMIPGI